MHWGAMFGRTINPISTRGQIMPTTSLRAPPPGFSDPRTVLHTTTLLILPYNHRHNRKIMRRVAVGRASASKELCCASRSIRFACNDHRRGHSKTILIGFWPFLTNYLLIYTLTFSKVVIPRKEFWFASHSQTNEKLSAHKQYEELFLSVWSVWNYFWYFALLILNIDKKNCRPPFLST